MMDLRQMMAAKRALPATARAAVEPAYKMPRNSTAPAEGELTAEQGNVVTDVLSGRSVFITGKAGTGTVP